MKKKYFVCPKCGRSYTGDYSQEMHNRVCKGKPEIHYSKLTVTEGDTVENACKWHDEQPDNNNKIRVGKLLDIIARLTRDLTDTEETLSIIQEGR